MSRTYDIRPCRGRAFFWLSQHFGIPGGFTNSSTQAPGLQLQGWTANLSTAEALLLHTPNIKVCRPKSALSTESQTHHRNRRSAISITVEQHPSSLTRPPDRTSLGNTDTKRFREQISAPTHSAESHLPGGGRVSRLTAFCRSAFSSAASFSRERF